MAYKFINNSSASGSSDLSNVFDEPTLEGANIGEVLKWDGDKYVPAVDNTAGYQEEITLNSTNILNKYVDLTNVPVDPDEVRLVVIGGVEQDSGIDFDIITDGSEIKRLTWNGFSLDGILTSGDKLLVSYS